MNIALLAASACLTFGGWGGPQTLTSSPVRTEHLETYSINLPQGKISLYLTNDLTQGKTFTGTVVATPNGVDDLKRSQNESILSGYVIDTGKEKASPGQHLKFLAPVAGTMLFNLLDSKGRPAGSFQAPLRPTPPVGSPSFQLPELVQPGKPVQISGPFDGDATNATIKVGGKISPVLAESPWQCVGVAALDIPPGMQTLELAEAGNSMKGDTRVVSISLQAQRTLVLGQSTPFDILIRGMEGYSQPSTLHLMNATPRTVKLADRAGGELGNHVLLDLPPFGAAETLRTVSTLALVALSTGGFEIECNFAGGLCGATTHQLFITGPSKSGNEKDGYSVEWTEVCYLGTCHLKKGHAGEHSYSWKKCKDHADVPHKETFKTKDERDAKYREVEKDRDKRKADNGF